MTVCHILECVTGRSLASSLLLQLELSFSLFIFTTQQCKLWKADLKKWTTTGCVTTPTPVTCGNTTCAECNCTQLGYIGLFTGEDSPVTIKAPVTNATTPPSGPAAPQSGVNVQFSLAADYYSAVKQAGSVAILTADIKTSVASKLRRPENKLQNFRISNGSIIVQFTLIPNTSESETSFNNTLMNLENQIKAGNFNVTLSSGAVLTAHRSSFKLSPVVVISTTVTTTTPALPVPAEESRGLTRTEIIVIACVCGAVVLSAIVGISVYCYITNKRGAGKISPPGASPEQVAEDMEMAGRGLVSTKRDHHGETNTLTFQRHVATRVEKFA